jgi:flagellar basal-body rod protein FlgC
MDLKDSLQVSAAGLKAQGTRVRIIAENVANSESTAITPNGDPYRRKTVTFRDVMDRSSGVSTVRVDKVGTDKSEFGLKYDPSNPGANAQGYVKTPNIKPLIEMMDLKQAQRSFEANVSVIDTSKSMIQRTIDLLR